MGDKAIWCFRTSTRKSHPLFPRRAHIHMLYGDVRWVPCNLRHKLSAARLWNRLVSLPTTRITSQVFLWDLSYSSQAGSWAFFVKNLFTEIGLAICFEEIMPCDLELAKQQLHDTYQATWNLERYSKPKLRYYNMFKPDLGQEEYLTLNISKHQRSLFAQFRGGILPLQVEIGRYRNLPLEQRICTLCDKNEVEHEFHLLCHCPIYEDIRKVLYNETITLYLDFYGNGRSATICTFSQQHSKTSHKFSYDCFLQKTSTVI